MKRTMYKNIAMLDARNVTEEIAQSIYEIKNVAMLIVTPLSQRALAGVTMKNVAQTSMLPDGAQVMVINGQGTLGGETFETEACKPVVLQVNGQLIVEASLKPETITKYICGGNINGQVIASESQMRALYAAGLILNGQAWTTPDGYERRSSGDSLTLAEVNSWPEGACKYMVKRVRVEEGVLDAMRARGMKIAGSLIVDREDADVLREVYEGDTGKCQFVPRGTRLITKDMRVNRRNALTLRGDVWATGDVTIESDVTEAMLAGVKSLHVQKKLIVPSALIGTLMDRVNEDVQWMPYEGKLIVNDENLIIDAEMLDEFEEVTLLNTADMTIEPDMSVEALREKVTMIYNEGEITGDKKQLAVLRARLAGGDGDFKERGEKEMWEEEATVADDLPEDVVVIGNCANMVIG